MIVVSDTSPITNLIQVRQLELLRELFDEVIISEAVYRELAEIPEQKSYLDSENWIRVIPAQNVALIRNLEKEIDSGEASSIALALEVKAEYLLIDERKGRAVAEQHGLKIVGLLGVLAKAKEYGFLVHIKPVLDDLIDNAGFRVHPSLYRNILNRVGE